MFNMVVLAKRRPGMSMEAFQDYYETRHAPLAMSFSPLVKKYRRTYITPVQGEMSAFGESPFDVFTETLFDSEADYKKTIEGFLANPKLVDTISKDEENLFDRPKIRWFIGDVRESDLGRKLTNPDGEVVKVTVLAKRKPGMSWDDFIEYYETRHAKLAMSFTPLVRRYTRTFLTPIQSDLSAGDSPFDVVTQAYFDSWEEYEANGKAFLGNPEIVETITKDELNLFDRPKIWWFSAQERQSKLA